MNLSKSRYTTGITCGKKLWLSCHKPEEAEDVSNDGVLENGTKIGELARGLFGDYELVEFDTNFKNMIDKTSELLAKKPNIICEASFTYDGNFCSVDILKNDKDGVEIYEVKSSTKISNIYIDDITYQTWVLKKLGLNVKKSYIVYVNNQYVKQGDFNIHEFFKIEDVTDSLNINSLDEKTKELKEVINKKEEPNVDLSIACHSPYPCPYFKYCTKKLPTPNVFDITVAPGVTGLEFYKKGYRSFEELLNANLTEKQRQRIEFELYDKDDYIDKEHIKEFLDSLTYPLYFLDFETFQMPIPLYDGVKPYEQVPFQYSLHYYEEENGELKHDEFLAPGGEDPRRLLAERLIKDIPKNVCVLAYNMSFEKMVIKRLGLLYPDLKEHLMNIHSHIKDLNVPFERREYYTKNMHGSDSIKQVLPALFPDDEELNYHNLEQIHNGGEASNSYSTIMSLPKEEQERVRKNLLKYCGLDTYAMVKILQKLKEKCK